MASTDAHSNMATLGAAASVVGLIVAVDTVVKDLVWIRETLKADEEMASVAERAHAVGEETPALLQASAEHHSLSLAPRDSRQRCC
jgi:hypothetical protein